MTPKEKAVQIYNKALLNRSPNHVDPKVFAHICADEIMLDHNDWWSVDDKNYEHSKHHEYWSQVKEEIKKL